MKYIITFFVSAALLAVSTNAEDPWTPSPLCPFPSTDLVRFPYEGDCSKYWECYNGARYPMDCPAGLEFNAVQSWCDSPHLANCDPDATIVYPTFPHSTVTTPSPAPTEDLGPRPECPFPSNELVFFPVVNNCAKYWECFQGVRYLMSCPSGLHWNTVYNYCDYAGNVDCSRNNATTTPSTTTSTTTPASNATTTTPGSNTPDPQCPFPSNDMTFFPHPTECNKYYECYQGHKYLMSCPTGLYWNDVENACDYKENVNCNRETTTTPTTSPGVNPDPQCPNTTDQITFFPHPTECSKYYECYLGHRYLMSCPTGLYWNDVENACDYKENVNCDRVATTTTSKPPSSTTKNPICVGQPDGTYLPNPNDCSKYYECVGGKIIEAQCPAGLLWNERARTCDYPENVSCSV